MGKLDAVKGIFKINTEDDKLALKIISKVKRVCKWYIKAEKSVNEVPNIDENNKDNIKTFLKALASKVGRIADVDKEMGDVRKFLRKKHYKDLFNPSNIKHMKSAQKLMGITNRDTTALSGIFQFAARIALLMNDIEKCLNKGDSEDLELKFKEMKDLIGKSEFDSGKWTSENGFIDNFKEAIGTSKDKLGIVTSCAVEVVKEAESIHADICGKILAYQKELKEIVESYKNEILTTHIQPNVEKYLENLKNIKNKLGKGSKYYEELDKESKSVADEIYNYLDGKMKEYTWEPAKEDQVVIENGVKFIKWAGSILNELDISDGADKEIKKWYDDMKDAYDVVRNAIEG